MRKKSVQTITAYMIFIMVVNLALILFLLPIEISLTEKLITIIASNGCAIWVARDFERYREIDIEGKRSNILTKNHKHS